MKKYIVAGSLGLGLLTLAGTANALTFNEAQGSTFEQVFNVTPTANNALVFSVSGSTAQFDALSFSFVGISGLSMTAAPSTLAPTVLSAVFNDFRNNSFTLTGNTAYQVKVSGHVLPSLPGGQGTVSVTSLNAIVTSVPEPETYAMFLAGLGLMGFMGRRRNIK